MTTDTDVRDFLNHLDVALPRPLHELGVQAGRDLRIGGPLPSGPEMHRVEEHPLPVATGDVGVRVYRPTPALDLPVLVYLHGGGWSIGSLDGVDALCRVLAEQAQCVVVSVDYRQAPEHPFPAPLDDAWAALTWVAAGGLDGVDRSTLAIGGDSAGGNLAAACTLLAREEESLALCAQLLLYPATDAADSRPSTRSNAHAPVLTAADVDWFWSLYVPDPDTRRHPLVSPHNAATLTGLPPAHVLTAELDPLRDAGEDYAALLAAAAVPVRLHRADQIFHGFAPMVGVLRAADDCADWAATGLRESFAHHRANVEAMA